MNILILGGDERFGELFGILEREGHRVFPMALEKCLPIQGPPDYDGAEALILPLPAERFGELNCPLAEGTPPKLSDILDRLPPGARVFGGMGSRELEESCRERGLIYGDYFRREDFQLKNALLTAEGALALMLGLDGKALSGRRALIAGFGRIGRMLAPRLKALAMDVWVMARSSEQRLWAEAMGCGALKFSDKAPKTDFVLNTVPERVLGEKELGPMGRPLLIELASAPGGFREEAVEKLKLKLVKAPGLPSKCCPTAAAEAIRDTIYNILEE